ncbi:MULTISPECIES: ABC transporter permease [unclassified Iodidimonas]|jgi:putative ABC transport system permease protein|uniref:ABC transporter permease n=1 Tax=unclassified Iodidimonas TaxID=2626145 RepID=UPI00248244E9|nr:MULTISPECIES: ABC transporter permease [unclassified Iodidimonas]
MSRADFNRSVLEFLARLGEVFSAPHLAMNISIAYIAIQLQVLRSTLTTLGVIVGVSSMILIATIGEGAKWKIEQSVNMMGSNMVILSATPDGNPAGGAAGRLTVRDVDQIAEKIPDILHAAPQIMVYSSLVAGNANSRTNVVGITNDYFAITKAEVARGRLLSDADQRLKARSIVVGATVARRLFGSDDPVGRSVRVNGVPFEIVGLLAGKGKSLSSDPDDTALIPLSTAMQRMRAVGARAHDAIDLAFIQFGQEAAIEKGEEAILSLLREKYRVGENDIDPFTLTSTKEFVAQSLSIITAIQLGLVAIASISLLVGSIGITNIMLVSVSERTREIGLRMALGARPVDIRNQFVVEAALLCLIGGVLGIVFGSLFAILVSNALDWPFSVDFPILVISLVTSVAVGVLAGAYPAIRASRLTPVEALRHD